MFFLKFIPAIQPIKVKADEKIFDWGSSAIQESRSFKDSIQARKSR